MKRFVVRLEEVPVLVPANDCPGGMTRPVREMLHALCRVTGHPFQPGQSQQLALAQINRLHDQLAKARDA